MRFQWKNSEKIERLSTCLKGRKELHCLEYMANLENNLVKIHNFGFLLIISYGFEP